MAAAAFYFSYLHSCLGPLQPVVIIFISSQPCLQGLPLKGDGSTAALYAVVLGCMGLLISWAAPACNNPIFAEIVPPHLRSMIYAFDRSFETAIAASAAPVVGLLAEHVFNWQVQSLQGHSPACKNPKRPINYLGISYFALEQFLFLAIRDAKDFSIYACHLERVRQPP